MTKRLVPLLVITTIAVGGATGCGDDTSSTLNDARDQADEIQKQTEDAVKDAGADPDKLRKQVEEAAKSGDTKKIREAAVKSCLTIADQIPVESEREKAKQQCRESVK